MMAFKGVEKSEVVKTFSVESGGAEGFLPFMELN